MPYKCAFGHTTFNPNCDACDSATESDNPYNYKEESHLKHKAAVRGMTLSEYLDRDDEE